MNTQTTAMTWQDMLLDRRTTEALERVADFFETQAEIDNLITAFDLELTHEWLDPKDFDQWAIVGKSTKKNADGTKYRLLVTAIRNPINKKEAAWLCGVDCD